MVLTQLYKILLLRKLLLNYKYIILISDIMYIAPTFPHLHLRFSNVINHLCIQTYKNNTTMTHPSTLNPIKVPVYLCILIVTNQYSFQEV